MEKVKVVTAIFLAGGLGFSCSSDDDRSATRIGYFPKTITITTIASVSSEVYEYTYNEYNQIVRLQGGEADVEFGYNDNGMISTVDISNSSENYTIEYDGNIVTSFTEVNTNDVFDLIFLEGRYSFEGGTRTFDSDNRLIATSGTQAINYSVNSGPFQEVDFQPVLFFLGGDAITRGSYFLATNEVTSFTIPL